MEFSTQPDENFFIVADELVEEQFEIVDNNLNGITAYMEMQASQQRVNFNFDREASLLPTHYTDIKSYRAA